jgi:Holliday junction DNA helicase RuvA
MIGSLSGTVAARLGDVLVVDVAGVGYEVQVPVTTLAQVGAVGANVRLWVHTRVREDAISLFGFSSLEERRWFEQLLGVHGVGPALALAILGRFTPASLAEAVRQGDVDALVVVPGVGPKSAMRLVVELRSCLDGLERVDVPEALGETNVLSEARSALEALGYPGADASRALQAAKAAGTDADDVAALVRGALRVLGGARVGA